MIIRTSLTKPQNTTISLLARRARAILKHRYNVQSGQRVLVIYDGSRERLGKAFAKACRDLGAEVDVFRLRKNRFSVQTHKSLEKRIRDGKYNVFINLIAAKSEEIKDRAILVNGQIKAQLDSGLTIIHGPSLKESMLELEIDHEKMIKNLEKLRDMLEGTASVHIRTKLGTDLRLIVWQRKFQDDILPKKVDLTNLPFGEGFFAPVEGCAFGTVVADASVGNFDLLPQPLGLLVQNGRLVKDSMKWLKDPSANLGLLKELQTSLHCDSGANVLCELGFGLADYPICGDMLQDEKAAETIHIAFGHNIPIGGKNASSSHIDFLIRSPDVWVNYIDSKLPRLIMREGKLLI
jgi:leucyl aminopeptidase (aminopeptidase T)